MDGNPMSELSWKVKLDLFDLFIVIAFDLFIVIASLG